MLLIAVYYTVATDTRSRGLIHMEQLTKILVVAGGGALGAVARHLVNISPAKDIFGKFPFTTFLINISGSFLIGFLLVLFTDRYGASENARLAFLVGFLGAYTTFSTFELETWALVREGSYLVAFLYVAGSVVTGFLAVIGGVILAKRV